MSNEDAAVLVFDGVCVLCNRSVQFVLRHDHEKRFRFATVQSDAGRRLMMAHGLDPDTPQSVLLLEGTAAYIESAAMLRVMANFGGVFRLSAALLGAIPPVMRDPVYRWVARNRYRWFGRYDVCMLPTPELRARLVQ